MWLLKVASGNSSHRLWILVLALSLLLLIAMSRSLFSVQPSPPSETFRVSASTPTKGQGYPPVLAYWICGTRGDVKRMLRLLKAIYHPRNRYLLQLDSWSSDNEREALLMSVHSEIVFRAFGNVEVVGKSYAINQMGSSGLSAILHAAALLLKLSPDWDWFINLSASDYPLVSQDDLLHAVNSLPRDLNFIEYTNDPDWIEKQNIHQVVVDPSLHLKKSSHLFYAVESRNAPDAFKIFGGSPWMILTRTFIEYCVQGWDNLPRKLLMYFSNTANPIQYYFHTVLCNSPEYKNTTINTDLRYQIPYNLRNGESELHCQNLTASGAAFARPFKEGDSALDTVDDNVLNRLPDRIVPGKWCLEQSVNNNTEKSMADLELCSAWSNNIDDVEPGAYGLKLGFVLSKLANEEGRRINQCNL